MPQSEEEDIIDEAIDEGINSKKVEASENDGEVVLTEPKKKSGSKSKKAAKSKTTADDVTNKEEKYA